MTTEQPQPEKTSNNPTTPTRQPTFKQQLDRAAAGATDNGGTGAQSALDTIIDKVTEYVPAAGEALSGLRSKHEEPRMSEEEAEALAKKQAEEEKTENTPQRPLHDRHIEDFVREQHRSKGDVMAEAGK